jgi:hypothetical protein
MDKHLPRQAEGQQNRQKGNEQAYIARQLSPELRRASSNSEMISTTEIDDMRLPLFLYKTTWAVTASTSVLEDSYQHAGTDSHDYQPSTERLRYSAHWLRVLNEGADFEVTDPRDKVYGVLGIITSPTTKFICGKPPRYSAF